MSHDCGTFGLFRNTHLSVVFFCETHITWISQPRSYGRAASRVGLPCVGTAVHTHQLLWPLRAGLCGAESWGSQVGAHGCWLS